MGKHERDKEDGATPCLQRDAATASPVSSCESAPREAVRDRPVSTYNYKVGHGEGGLQVLTLCAASPASVELDGAFSVTSSQTT